MAGKDDFRWRWPTMTIRWEAPIGTEKYLKTITDDSLLTDEQYKTYNSNWSLPLIHLLVESDGWFNKSSHCVGCECVN